MSRLVHSILGAVFLLLPSLASAGGTDLPDNGTEALGRGGAFVAKADNGLALYYNIAGLARQRGTRLTIDGNFVIHDIAFTREGSYPGNPQEPTTPFAGQPYEQIHDSSRIFAVPYLGLSTDFGWFKRWTFGFGVYGPPGVGIHNYGVGSDASPIATVKLKNGMTAPAPSRYDISQTNLLIVLPTLAAAYSPVKYLDLGVALQLVYANFNLTNANITNLGMKLCPGTPENPNCDAYGNLQTSGTTWGFMVSAMAHPVDWIDIGVNYRPQVDVHTEGTIFPTPPPSLKTTIAPAPVNFNSSLPHLLRLGARAVSRYGDGTERADVELDMTYENWSNKNDRWGRSFDGYDPPQKYRPDHIYSPDFMLGAGGELNVDLNRGYKDTVSIRAGGAYNHRLNDTSRLIARAGVYFDSATTAYEHTRLDFNTAAKYAVTVGGGYKIRGFTLNIAYAFVYSPSRSVTNSVNTAVDAMYGTNYGPNSPVIAVGNGLYEPSTHILSVGVSMNFNEFKTPRLFRN